MTDEQREKIKQMLQKGIGYKLFMIDGGSVDEILFR